MKLIDILAKISKGELKEGAKVNLIADDYITYLYFDGEVIRFVATNNIYAFTCKDINDEDEYELIEPECKHVWKKYSLGRLGGITENHRKCKKCGIDEIEAEENATEKIKELDFYDYDYEDLEDYRTILTITDKLNEVIRRINNERL